MRDNQAEALPGQFPDHLLDGRQAGLLMERRQQGIELP